MEPTFRDRERFPHFWTEVNHFFEKEEKLIRSEVHEKAHKFKVAGATFAFSAAFLIVGLYCLASFFILLLITLNLNPLQATLTVTVAFLATGGVLYYMGKSQYNQSKTRPERSIENYRHFKDSIKDKFRDITHH